jgi:hypothetical protein
MGKKQTMTLNLTAFEMAVLNKLAEDADVSKTVIIRQALRLYQLVDARLKAGERFTFSGDQDRALQFIGIGLGENHDQR